LLDAAGLRGVQIFASSGLDEYQIATLLAAGAPIDGFGVGTQLAVSADAPDIDFSYKLVAYDGQPRMKLSSSKVILPGRKQVFRRIQAGQMVGDVIGQFDESLGEDALLQPVMRHGKRLDAGRVSLATAREHARTQRQALPPELHRLEEAKVPYPIEISPALQATTAQLRRDLMHTM
jgi:nicotinate phosphoribosyltransferase